MTNSSHSYRFEYLTFFIVKAFVLFPRALASCFSFHSTKISIKIFGNGSDGYAKLNIVEAIEIQSQNLMIRKVISNSRFIRYLCYSIDFFILFVININITILLLCNSIHMCVHQLFRRCAIFYKFAYDT